MSLQRKAIVMLAGSLAVLMGVVYLIAAFFGTQGFRAIEEKSTAITAQAALGAIETEADFLSIKLSDWSSWDDAYEFVQDLNPAFVDSNMQPEAITGLGLSAVVFFDACHQVKFSRVVQANGTELAEGGPALIAMCSDIIASGPFQRFEDVKAGVFLLPDHPVLVAARPILKTNREGDPRGILIFVKPIDEDLVQRWATRSKLTIDLWRLNAGGIPADVIPPIGRLTSDQPIAVDAVNDDVICGYTVVRDVLGRPALALRTSMSRYVTREARSVASRFFAVTFMSAGVLVVLAWALLRVSVLRRLRSFQDAALRITQDRVFDQRLEDRGNDEISTLASAMNTLLDTIMQEKAKAEAANRAKSDFLANMSHEIRTPMTAILGYADLLLDPVHAPDTRTEFVETIRRNGEHLLALINDILDLSKIESGKMTVERIPMSPFAVLDDVVTLLAPRARAKGIALDRVLDSPVPNTLTSDPTRLRQVLINLIGNAIKFTDQGSVSVRMRFDPAPTPTLTFEVHDTGIGMAPEQLERLFQPFVQADSSMSRRFGGTGLGLTISRQFAEMLGGSIRVSSAAGVGSTFRFRVDAGEYDAASMREHLRGDGGAACPALGQRVTDPSSTSIPHVPATHIETRILLAEDGPDNQRLLRFHLERAGFDVQIVANGRLACEAVRAAATSNRPFALILMDMQMPEMDGYAATTTLRREGCRIPILALTAHAMPADRKHCLDAGCNDYLTKPVDRDHLLNTIRAWINESRAATSRAA